LRIRPFFDDLRTQISPLLRGVHIDAAALGDLRLPPGTYAEWAAVLQNVLLNAINATMDARRKTIRLSTHAAGRNRSVLIEDTGVGVDVASADRLFEPFERHTRISRDRRALGYGGTGLGLTIVRMIASELGAHVRFVEPVTRGFKTAFRLSWMETE
jgi:signal transduction histidine kinase